MRADGKEAYLLLFEPEVQSVFDGNLQLWQWNGGMWIGKVLCCANPVVYVSNIDGHYTIGAE